MKKLLIIALFVQCMYNALACANYEAPALETAQEINWMRFLGCHIIKPSVLLPQITACLQAQLIIQ